MKRGKPLDGVTVLDLTRLLPGAYCTLLLADMGARVIKIEDPRLGDPVRLMPPVVDGESVYFHSLNRDKSSITLDLRSGASRAVLDRLIARADVFVESFRPRTARKLGVDGASLLARYPRLVHCSITGFGQDGPYAERAGHDINYVALAGLLAIDTLENFPHVPRMFIADIGGGALSATAGIAAALFARERTGTGTTVDVSMHEGALAWLTFPGARALMQGGDVTPADLPIFELEGCYNVYRAADGQYVALGALEPKFFRMFCERIGRPELAARQFDRGPQQAALHGEIERIFATRTRREWLDLFADADVCLSTVNTVREALDDPHVEARKAVAEHGGRRFLLSPILFDAAGRDAAIRRAPALGAQTDAILEEAGFDAAARARLRAEGTV